MYAAALAEDPNAFDYDGVYDSIQEQKAAPKQQDRIDRKPKYIANLLEQAQVRKREQDISYESRLVSFRHRQSTHNRVCWCFNTAPLQCSTPDTI